MIRPLQFVVLGLFRGINGSRVGLGSGGGRSYDSSSGKIQT